MTAANPGKRRASGRGALVVLAGLLLGSAVLRLGDDAGRAMARVPDTADADETTRVPDMANTCETPEDLAPLLEAVDARESSLDEREVTLKAKMEALTLADRRVSRKLDELQAAEDELRDMIALADEAAEGDIDRLTKVYENMKPEQAAALFEEMAPTFAAGFLGRMRPQAAAAIMAGLSPAAAHSVSVVIAGRNANVPTE
ncbi:MotE family protein [Roseovarius sp. SYSU LYC5161]|uniref:MotE family protein n=1 Tax=Roseovarius halophilus (ex Wu et al. 2025) TaxID=3376060 RepID=UPI00287241B6|nr:hypothetical protein [Roseovarius sp.]